VKQNEHYNKVLKITGILVTIAFIIWFIFYPLTAGTALIQSKIIYGRLSTILAGVGVFWLLYYGIIWKWKFELFRLIFFDKPDLTGTWMGYLKSNYTKKNVSLPPIKIALFIRQENFFDIRITSQTSTYAGFSFGETLEYDTSNKMTRLLYQYSQKNTLPDSKDDKQGAADLFLYENYLAGHYWTLVNTSGFIRVHKLTNKTFRSFEEADKMLGQSPILKECLKLIEGVDLTTKL
jgi:hypothetical protein